MNLVQKFKEKIYYFYILYINVIIYLYMGPLLWVPHIQNGLKVGPNS